jgi:hypothetical protein
MKVIAQIEDAAVVRKIPEHLDQWQTCRGDERGTAPEMEPDRVYDPVEDGWLGWSDDISDNLPAIVLQ